MQLRGSRPTKLCNDSSPFSITNTPHDTSSLPQHQSTHDTSDLIPLLNSLQETLAKFENGEATLEAIRRQIEDLRQIRARLEQDACINRTFLRYTFRQKGGYDLIVNVLYLLKDLPTACISSSGQIGEFLNVFDAVLDLLSSLLKHHPSNVRFFTTQVRRGGWIELERVVTAIGLGQLSNFAGCMARHEDLGHIFGSLFAFALGNETLKQPFRGISELCVSIEADRLSADSQDPLHLEPEIESAIRQHIRDRFSGDCLLFHYQILPIIVSLWSKVLHHCQHVDRPNRLLFAVPLALRTIQITSERNELAVHHARILHPLLSALAHLPRVVPVFPVLQMILTSLLAYGLNHLKDALYLFRNASTSDSIADLILSAMHASASPAFVQFDLTRHGFSSIELPSLGCQFPPPSPSLGYSIITWVKFNQFDNRSHTTIFGASDHTQTCFVLLFVEKEARQLVLQTSIRDAPKASVRFQSAPFQEDQWYHIAIVHRKPRSFSNPSRALLFINAVFTDQPKCLFPASSQSKGLSGDTFATITGTAHQHSVVQAFLGTPQGIAVSEPSKPAISLTTKWSFASFFLFQDAIGEEMIQIYHALGPRYVGNFQDSLGSFQTYRASSEIHLKNEQMSPEYPDKSVLMTALRQHAGLYAPRPKIIINFSPTAVVQNQFGCLGDASLLIKHLPRDAALTLDRTLRAREAPVIINSAVAALHEAIKMPHGLGFLTGDPVLSIPQSLDDACWRIGGSAPVVLKLLDQARTKVQVIRAIEIVFASIENSWRNSEAIERGNAYGVLIALMREKLGFAPLLGDSSSTHYRRPTQPVQVSEREELALELLRMTLKFVGYNEAKPEAAVMVNSLAYRFLLVDFDTWRKSPIATQKIYYGQFVHYAAKGLYQKFNAQRLIRMRIVKRLIDALKAESFSVDVFPDFLEAFSAVFRCSISGETLRSLALYITYTLQEGRLFQESQERDPLHEDIKPADLPSRRASRRRSVPPVSPFNPPTNPIVEVTKYESGVQMLDLFVDILCQPAKKDIEKFAATVSRNWMLFLLGESDSRVIVHALKILVRVMVTHGREYVNRFDAKDGGFTILKLQLKTWWSVPAVWISLFALLFGVDVSALNFETDFSCSTLSDMFFATGGKIINPEAFTLIVAMLESGLRTAVSRGQGLAGGYDSHHNNHIHCIVPTFDDDHDDVVRARHTFDVTKNVGVINTVILFLSDIHLKSSSFREFAASSLFTQELLSVLYPIIVTAENVSADTELNSRGSVLTFEGQDVVIRPQLISENQQLSVIRTATDPSTISGLESTIKNPCTSLKRSSSFILVTSDPEDVFKPSKFIPSVDTSSTSGFVKPHIESIIVQNLLGMIVSVFLDMVLYRKEFPGFGIFLKVPPSFQEHQAYFESYILSYSMSKLSSTLNKEKNIMTEPRVITNIARYATYMAEALFEGWFVNGAAPLTDFVGQVLEYLQRPEIASLKNVRLCSQATTSLKRTFFRTILLRLSALDEHEEQKATVQVLERLSYWQMIILSADIEEHQYLQQLFFLLYCKVISKVHRVQAAAIDFWRLLLIQKPQEAASILTQAAVSKQSLIVSHFMRLVSLDNEMFLVWVDNCRGELDALFFGPVAKRWEEFVSEENKRTEETARFRLDKRRDRLRLWSDEEKAHEDHWRRHESGIAHWRKNVHASERLKHQRALQDQQDNLNFMAMTLEKFDRILKGPCQLFEKDPDFKWRLDETEGMNRMRLRLIPDRPSTFDNAQPRRKPSDTHRQRATSQSFRSRTSASTTSDFSHEPSSKLQGLDKTDNHAGSPTPEDEYEIVDDPKIDEGGEFEDKNRKVMRTLQRNDIVQRVYNVSRIDGLEPLEGLLIVGKHCMYLIDHFFQRADGEVVGVWQAPIEERDPYLRLVSGRETRVGKPKIAPGESTTRYWRWDGVMLVSKRRFLQRDVALEVFFTDGRSYLLTTATANLRNELHSSLVTHAPVLKNSSSLMLLEDQWRVESLRNLEDTPQSLGLKFASVFNLAAANPATRKWIRGEISNFAYLMQINTMAGRTFNDLTQYPVFPWVLADYTSRELDLSDPRTFRDLSKPMGCQHPSREAEFRERYNTIAEMTSQPPFHYGTHYSSAMTVAGYLIRLQPFVKTHLLLQGGYFDHADRQFYSVEKAWSSASRDQITDVRELTPEFFYLPEFLVNKNKYEFGTLQTTGQKIDDVVLPPWAHDDAHIFIQRHREALESPYVSSQLHKWIDLIFGFKQQGEAAIEATNCFHFLSYHGAKDLDMIKDPQERLSSIGIIHNFGQTPRQLFTRPHPSRDDGGHKKNNDLNTVLQHLTRSHMPIFEFGERVSTILFTKTDQMLVQGPLALYVPSSQEVVMKWGFADGSIKFASPDGKRAMGSYENLHIGPTLVATLVNDRTLITAGTDCVITIWNMSLSPGNSATGITRADTVDITQRESLFGHFFPITILITNKGLGALLSADSSGRVLLWDVNRNEFVRELRTGLDDEHYCAEITSACISAATGDVALCINRSVYLYSLNGKLLLQRDVCATSNACDSITCSAWYEGIRGEWLQRVLLFTGHRDGSVRIWHKTIDDKTGKWALQYIRKLPPIGTRGFQTHTGLVQGKQKGGFAPPLNELKVPVSCIMPRNRSVWVGDDHGRVDDWYWIGV